jgi:HlyD family secretion protein
MRKVSVAAAVVIAAAGFLYYYYGPGRSSSDAEPGRTFTVMRGDVTAKLAETGSLEPTAVVEIKSEQSGEVKKLFVKEGDEVRAGQKLAIIQQESGQARMAAEYRANLEDERLNMEEAEKELERMKSLKDKGFASEKDVEDAQRKFERAKVNYDLAMRSLRLVLGGSAEVLKQYLSRDLSSGVLDEFTIHSPGAGTVIKLTVEEGEMITSGTATVGGGTPLMEIADLSNMLVKCKVNEVNIPSVKIGETAEVRLDALPGRSFHGTVTAIAPTGERVDNVVTYEVTIRIDDAEKLLKPSMTANVDIVTGVFQDVLYLPIEAIGREDGRDVVWIESAGKPESRPLKILERTESVAVISEGVGENDRVLLPAAAAEESS